ncbi:MAG: glycosyl transferase [Flavobacteriales bacterium]|nr:MAG: glycosyl transferase [Flavobacteriales bacterium]
MKDKRKKAFYEHFENLAEKYPTYRKRYGYYWNRIINYCNYFIHEDNSVLEIGCGTGQTISKLKGKNKTGIDFSPKMIEQAKNRYANISFHVMEAENIELEEKFDVIIISNVVGFFENVLDVFESVKKVCHKDTRIIITYYNYIWEPMMNFGEFIGIKTKTPQQNWLSTNDIENLFYLSDFQVFNSSKDVLLPVNIPIFSYLLNKFIAPLPLFNSLCLNSYVSARAMPVKKEATEAEYSVSIVIPARNESGNIENAIKRMPAFGKHVEVIFVEGNSTDDTWEKIREVSEKYKDTHDIKTARQDGKGKGDAVRKGFSMATSDILMILDADLTVPPEELPKFYNAIASGKADFINGSRLVYPMGKQAMRFLNVLGNKFFSNVFSWILGFPIKDTLCGTKVMFRKDYEKLTKNRAYFGDFDPFGDFDLLFGAHKLNLKIVDLPIHYQERTYGDTNISRFSHGWLLLKMCWFAIWKLKFK